MPTSSAPQGSAQVQFPCENCGSTQGYTPGSDRLTCESCGHVNRVNPYRVSIHERDFHRGLDLDVLERVEEQAERETRSTVKCGACAAEFDFSDYEHAGECPYCASNIVLDAGRHRRLKPQALIPFAIDRRQAVEAFDQWVKGLWFAPGALSSRARRSERLRGIYVPHWTYDSFTQSRYSGMRGVNYVVPETYTVVENGRTVTRTRMVTRIRWTPVRGRVSRDFDDVLVVASQTLPFSLAQQLRPWPLGDLQAYQPDYLSGFRSEIYQLGLREGFARACDQMAPVIRRDVRRDIGGDHQRITHLNTQYDDITFKLLLLPMWIASFKYNHKTYRFLVNAITGRVAGERPYSFAKIALAFLGAALIFGLAMVFLEGR